ncbi:MAG: flagellar biosynthesis anti-sigma factor FlgM [Lachnospiraceae bacterium]|nr:flagellar biosynthesis anti-sigma factor FlgM [Lachnospiraceae bacterium]
MRIDAYTQMQVQKLTSAKNASRPQQAASARPSFSDQLQLSSAGKDIQTAKAAVNKAPDIRTDLVNSIKEQIKNGTYSVDVDSFADKLYSNFQALG